MNNKWNMAVMRNFLALAVLLSVTIASIFSVQNASAQRPNEPVTPQDISAREKQIAAQGTDQIIVQYKAAAEAFANPTADAQMERVSQTAGVAVQYGRAMSGDAHVLRLSSKMTVDEVQAIADRLMTLPEVANAEPDLVMYHTIDPVLPAAVSPNDPLFANQWDLYGAWGIGAPTAWDTTKGASSVVVAVVDTGITNHAEFAGRTVQGYDFISNIWTANDGNGRDNNPSDPGDWLAANECGPDAETSSWHGTHTAGTIGATSNNGIGVAGINWMSKIEAVRVLGKCGGSFSDVIDGMRWAAGLTVPGVPTNANPARVLNVSLGGSGSCSSTMQTAVNQIVAAGAVIVVSAGNSAADAVNFVPSNCNGVITVAATGPTGDLTYYSNYGSVVEISAPGGEMHSAGDPNGVLSTLNTGLMGPVADTYVYYQGTSMAAPHVSGIASLLFSLNPNLTPAQVLEIIQGSAKAFSGSAVCNTSICGAGVANAAAALKKAVITISGDAGAAGVKLTYVNGGIKTVTSDGTGKYTFDVPYSWSGTVTPSLNHYVFSPAQRTYTNLVNDQPNKNYTANPLRMISGNAGAAGATLTYTENTLKTVTAAANGYYSFFVSNGFTGTVTVSKAGYTYPVDYINYTNVTADMPGQHYNPNEVVRVISGNVGASGVTISYNDGSPQAAISNNSGDYSLLVPNGFTGTLTPSKASTTFNPTNRDYSSSPVTTALTAQDFVPTITLVSNATYDGWVLESEETSNAGGTMNSSAGVFQLGDDALDRQYRAILSFDTAELPDNAVIQSAVLKIRQNGTPVGTNPFSILLNLWADIRKGPFGAIALEVSDFHSAATVNAVSPFNATPVGGWYSNTLNATGRNNINKTNVTQFRLYFSKDDNDNSTADYMKFISGNGASNQPVLVITFTVP